MRLDLLLEREPFPAVLAATLSHYLANTSSWQGQINWLEGVSEPFALRVHPKLNLIVPPTCPVQPLRTLAAEYAYHPQGFRRFLQTAYVHFAVSWPLNRVLSRSSVQITPFPEGLANCCILGGNHSLRIVDLIFDTCVVVLKRGYRPSYLETTVHVRRTYPQLPGPRLLSWDLAQGWYVEERMLGLPLNRVADPILSRQALGAARAALLLLYDQTAMDEVHGDWIDERLSRIAEETRVLPSIYTPDVRREIHLIATTLANALRDNQRLPVTIPTVISHGDFQPGNIIVPSEEDEGPVYLIDWEYAGRRCRWYDALVFALQSRFPQGLAERVQAFWRNDAAVESALSWCGEGAKDHATIVAFTLVFLLDDLLLRVEENLIPELRQPSAGFLHFLRECQTLCGMMS